MNASHRFVAALVVLAAVLASAATALLVCGAGRARRRGARDRPAGSPPRRGASVSSARRSPPGCRRWARASPWRRSAPPPIGALAEKPELFGRLLIFVGLAEGIAIYGLIVSILILNRLVVSMARPVYHRRRSQRGRLSARRRCACACRSAAAKRRRSPTRAPRRRWCSSPRRWPRGSRRARCATALAALAPLVLIVPDLAGAVPVPDLAARLRRQLGMEA